MSLWFGTTGSRRVIWEVKGAGGTGQYTRVLQRGLQYIIRCRTTRFGRGIDSNSRRGMASNLVCIQESHWSRTKVLWNRERGLVLVWACERFNIYVYGRKFQLESDHKPHESMFGRLSNPRRALNVRIAGKWTQSCLSSWKSEHRKRTIRARSTHTQRHQRHWFCNSEVAAVQSLLSIGVKRTFS